jgi:hypothetical protein
LSSSHVDNDECVWVRNWFCRIKWIPTGGLFVTGGLTPKNIQYIEGLHSDFMISYLNKGRVSPLLKHVDLGVRGAHKAALMEYEKCVDGSSGQKSQFYSFLGERSIVFGTLSALSVALGSVVHYGSANFFHE